MELQSLNQETTSNIEWIVLGQFNSREEYFTQLKKIKSIYQKESMPPLRKKRGQGTWK